MRLGAIKVEGCVMTVGAVGTASEVGLPGIVVKETQSILGKAWHGANAP